MQTPDLVRDTSNAFTYVQRLYDETATLIREVERLIGQRRSDLGICRPSGYAITSRSSTGLDGSNVERWMTRRLAVAFSEAAAGVEQARTTTPLGENVRILYLRVLLDGYERFSFDGSALTEPTVLYGIFTSALSPKRKPGKFEAVLSVLEYAEPELMSKLPVVEMNRGDGTVRGRLERLPLFSLTDPKTVDLQLVVPWLAMYDEAGARR